MVPYPSINLDHPCGMYYTEIIQLTAARTREAPSPVVISYTACIHHLNGTSDINDIHFHYLVSLALLHSHSLKDLSLLMNFVLLKLEESDKTRTPTNVTNKHLDSKSLYTEILWRVSNVSNPKLHLEIGKVKLRLIVHCSVSTQTVASNTASQAEVSATILCCGQ